MKKIFRGIGHFFELVLTIIAFALYPLLALIWWRNCHKSGDPDAKRFAAYALIGFCGAAIIVLGVLVGFPWSYLMFIIGIFCYGLGLSLEVTYLDDKRLTDTSRFL